MLKRFVEKFAFIGMSLALASPAVLANVSLKNGNFFIGYTDHLYPGGFEPKIERVYNSKTPYKGIFGRGWGNEYEAYLTVSADGSVVVYEYGGGAENRFNPKSFNKKELNQAIDLIVGAAKKIGGIGNASQLNAYKEKLKSDATFRNDEWEKFVKQNVLKPRQLKDGTQLLSNKFSFQYITKTAQGYVRSFDNGRTELFDNSGKLIRIQDKNNNFIALSYGKDGKLEKITDNFNRKMFFSFNSRGLVEKVQGENKKESRYKYNDKDELIWTKDADGNVYTHAYSSDNRHNMTEIGYSDKTTLKIAYQNDGKYFDVKSVKDRDGSVTEYAYKRGGGNSGKTQVGLTIKDSKGKVISRSSYEYLVKKKANGEEWTYKLTTNIDGDRTETTYNECCGLPLLIKRGKSETAFAYDVKGRVTQKTTPSEVTRLAYHPKVGKVTRVEKYSKVNKKDKSWSTFQYDAKGNLVFAKNSERKGVKLFYDNHGRIRSMIDQARRRIDFKYNEHSKPIEISDPALGAIKVNYTNSGEIKNVEESQPGRKIASQVTTAFQNLLEIIRPAGVTLSF